MNFIENDDDLPLLKSISIVGDNSIIIDVVPKKVNLNLYSSTRSKLTELVVDLCENMTLTTQGFDWDNADFKEAKIIGSTVMKLTKQLASLKKDCEEDELTQAIIQKTISILCIDLQKSYDFLTNHMKTQLLDVDNFDRINYLNYLGELLGYLSGILPSTSDIDPKDKDKKLDSSELKWFDS